MPSSRRPLQLTPEITSPPCPHVHTPQFLRHIPLAQGCTPRRHALAPGTPPFLSGWSRKLRPPPSPTCLNSHQPDTYIRPRNHRRHVAARDARRALFRRAERPVSRRHGETGERAVTRLGHNELDWYADVYSSRTERIFIITIRIITRSSSSSPSCENTSLSARTLPRGACTRKGRRRGPSQDPCACLAAQHP